MLSLAVPRAAPTREIIFYDGHCGLCHGAVKFVLRHDASGGLFRFAPLAGPTFQSRVPPDRQASLPDSIVVLAEDGSLLLRSNAFLHILRRLGRGWGILAGLLRVIPRPVRDFVYDFIARIRYRVFGRREDVCPIIKPEWRARFEP
jgi:predicted DCC family thiol-disulfide oxidoreductase YuxK